MNNIHRHHVADPRPAPFLNPIELRLIAVGRRLMERWRDAWRTFNRLARCPATSPAFHPTRARAPAAVVVAVVCGAALMPWPTIGAEEGLVAPLTRVTTGPIATHLNCSAEASAADYDGDGDLDVVVSGFGPGRTVFYRNDGGGNFTQLTDTNALPFLAIREALPISWGDYDNDGRPDLAVLGDLDFSSFVFSNCRVFRNFGDGTFRLGPYLPNNMGWTAGWADFDHDGFLDFLIPQWLGNPPLVLRNDGAGGFRRMTQQQIGDLAAGLPFAGGLSCADYDDDGWIDVLIAWTKQNLLFRGVGSGRFEAARSSGLNASAATAIAGAWGDYDNDGDLDMLFANVPPNPTGDLAILYRNQGDGTFTNVTGTALPALDRGNQTLANAAAWADIDNDGYLDASLSCINEFLHNNGDGTFSRFTSGDPLENDVPRSSASYNHLWFDYDNDGFLDLFVTNGSDYGAGGLVPSFLYRNQGNAHHWLKVQPIGRSSNRLGAGAKVRVRAVIGGEERWQRRDITAGGIFNGSQLIAHFGLGDATRAEEILVEWPSGNVQSLFTVAADQVLTVFEPDLFRPSRPVATINGSVTLTNLAGATARQWYFDGEPLPDQTNRMLTLRRIQPGQEGRYSVVGQTASGPITNHVHLRVEKQFTKILEGDIVTEEYGFDEITWFDFDGDDWLDAYATHDYDYRGTVPDSLFRNQRDGTFAKMPDGPLTVRQGASINGVPADYDGDGDVDILAIRNVSPTFSEWHVQLLKNKGMGEFTESSALPSRPIDAEAWDAAWADYDRDGDVDLFLAQSVNGRHDNALYRNDGKGHFVAMTSAELGGLLSERRGTWLCTWIDYDGDMWPDLLLQHSNAATVLHRNNGNGTFTKVHAGSLSTTRASSSLAWGDYDNDGHPDLFVGKWSTGHGRLYRNLDGVTFTNIAEAGDLRDAALGFDCLGTWGDYDNDGHLDLMVVGYNDPGKLLRNRGDGTFQSVHAGNLLTDGSRRCGANWVDYNNDGFLDLMVSCGDGVWPDWPAKRCHLYRNNGNGNHWVKVRLVGTTSNRDGIGAKVRVTAAISGRTFTQLREISGNSPFCGTVPLLAHFGLGNAAKVTTVRIDWPSGLVQELQNVPVNQFLTITEPSMLRLTCCPEAGGVRIACQGEPHATYDLQLSYDLKRWMKVQTTTADAAGGVAVLVTPGTISAQFYRALKR